MPQDAALRKFASPVQELTPLPRPICRECNEGHIRFAEPAEAEHGDSKEARSHPAWEPDWIKGTFTTTGRCENDNCGHTVAAAGTYEVTYARSGRGHEYLGDTYASFYTFRHFSPPLRLLQIEAAIPEPVREGFERAAAVVYADPGLAATALRLVVEQFLTAEGIPAATSNSKPIGVDRRITTWKTAAPHRDRVADLLLAAKWIGNVGTHSLATLTATQVLEAADYLSEAFHALLVTPGIDARAQAVNQARGLVPPNTP